MLKLVCLTGWKGKVLPVLPKEDRLREDPDSTASPVCKGHEKPAWKGQTALHKYSPGLLAWEVHQHFPKGCNYPARCMAKI